MVRNESIDVFKGLGMVLVLVGHSAVLPVRLIECIYAFHMPLFYLAAGIFFNINKLAEGGVISDNLRPSVSIASFSRASC